MFKQISKHISHIEVVDFEDLKEFHDYERIPRFASIAPDVFSLFVIWRREPIDYDAFLLSAITHSNLIRKPVYDELEKHASKAYTFTFLTLENDKRIMVHAVGKNPKEPKNDHYQIEFHEWITISKLYSPCMYWIKASNAKHVSDALSIMLPDATIWLDELHKHVSDISRLKLGLILRKLGIATRRVYDTTTKRLRRKIVTPKRMLKTAIEKYQLS